jgi:hypothetical protein
LSALQNQKSADDDASLGSVRDASTDGPEVAESHSTPMTVPALHPGDHVGQRLFDEGLVVHEPGVRRMMMGVDLAEIQKEICVAVNVDDRATLRRHIAADVVWNGGAAEGGLDGIDMFFAAVEKFRENYAGWEVLPQVIMVQDRVMMVHQIDRVTLADGTGKDLRYNLYIEYNDRDQIQRVWEYGGSIPIEH